MRMLRLILLFVLVPAASLAKGEKGGDFDYYILSLSWSPSWCALEGRARGARQCTTGSGSGWVLHGLWPQYENGWPSYCLTGARDPSRRETRAMADIMGSAGAAWHQWKKHGRCSGLPPEEYFAKARAAFEAIRRPEILRRLRHPVRLPASVIEDAFLEANPDLEPDMITITCREGRIQEARICLSRGLEPRRCGADVIRDCRLNKALLAPVR